MAKVIPFRTREEWEAEKKQKIKDDWDAYIEWEEMTLKRVREEQAAENETESEGELDGISQEEMEWLIDWVGQGVDKND